MVAPRYRRTRRGAVLVHARRGVPALRRVNGRTSSGHGRRGFSDRTEWWHNHKLNRMSSSGLLMLMQTLRIIVRRSVLPLFAVLLFSHGGAAQTEDISSPKLRVSWTEFKKLYDAGKVEVVDVRGNEAFEAGHIPGARSIPLDEVEKRVDVLKKAAKPIIVYCA